MKQIGITEVREILLEVLTGYTEYHDGIPHIPDEKLLKTNLRDEFGMDSLDFEDMFDKLYDLYGISIDMYNPLTEFAFRREQTVENFIDMVNTINRVNYNLSQKA